LWRECRPCSEPTQDANLQAQIAARQGAQVDRVCFTREIDGWCELGDGAILIENGANDLFKLDLLGTASLTGHSMRLRSARVRGLRSA
jgi:hypothetical protein